MSRESDKSLLKAASSLTKLELSLQTHYARQRRMIRSFRVLEAVSMFFIYGTDAPLYHYPIVTGVMVAVNVIIHWLVYVTGVDVTPCILAFGDGYHPIQWVTHNFLHIGWLHLIGNMLFLFPFGMVVEGKIGWLRMLLLYMAIGTLQGFTQQTLMLPSDPIHDAEAMVEMMDHPDKPLDEKVKEELKQQWRQDLMQEGFGSLGASAVIFGLLAVCVLWAPTNNFDVYFRWGLFMPAPDGGIREWAISTVCAMFVAKEVFMFWMMGMPISSEALHLNGFIVGGACGLVMLLRGLVDCEGHDLLSYWSGTPFKAKSVIAQEKRERAEYLESLKPTGPPAAVVPLMPHQIQQALAAQVNLPVRVPAAPLTPSQTTAPVSATRLDSNSVSSTSKTIPIAPTLLPASPNLLDAVPKSNVDFFTDDLRLPDFDDGVGVIDPIIETCRKIEAMVSRNEFAVAVRELAGIRKSRRDFVISAGPMGRLAEGLIGLKQFKPAITVLTIGCEAYPAYEPRWRIRIASIHLAESKDPIAAIKQLRMIDKGMLDSKLRDQYVRLATRAKELASQ